MSRLSRRDRRASILEAARKALAKRGFLATRAEDIAQAAGVSAALLFRYFPTLRAIQGAVLARELERPALPATVITSGTSPRAALRAVADALGGSVDRDHDGLRLALFASLTDLPASTGLLRRYVVGVERPLAELLGSWRSRGWIAAELDSNGLARMISHALLFEAVTGILLDPGWRAEGFKRAIDGVVILLGLAEELEPEILLTVPQRPNPERTPFLRGVGTSAEA